VRVWPLDLSEFIVEARYDAGVTSVDLMPGRGGGRWEKQHFAYAAFFLYIFYDK
jgi:hypothetical protein